MDLSALIAHLRSLENRRNVEGMRRLGITPGSQHLGMPIPVLRALARPHLGDHAHALGLWASGIHEARILAAYVDDPARVTARQMDAWARDFVAMIRDYGWRGGCTAAGVTDAGVGSGEWLGVFT